MISFVFIFISHTGVLGEKFETKLILQVNIIATSLIPIPVPEGTSIVNILDVSLLTHLF